jgi:hypothetical protein
MADENFELQPANVYEVSPAHHAPEDESPIDVVERRGGLRLVNDAGNLLGVLSPENELTPFVHVSNLPIAGKKSCWPHMSKSWLKRAKQAQLNHMVAIQSTPIHRRHTRGCFEVITVRNK